MPEVCTLASSSKGNACVVSCKGSMILVDAGLSLKQLTQRISELGSSVGKLEAVLVTHEHADHIKGLPMLASKFSMPIFASRGTSLALRRQFPKLEGRITPFFAGDVFNVGEFRVESFPTSHDSAESVGYVFRTANAKITIATDMGCTNEDAERAVEGADLLLLEANHDVEMLWMGPYPLSLKRRILGKRGHLSNDDSARLALHAAKGGTRRIVLIHLSEENNTPELALETVGTALREKLGSGFELDAAPARTQGKVYVI